MPRRCLEQDSAGDAEPASVEGLHLVSDSHMGVQVRVAGAAVAVGERGCDQPLHVDLPYPVGAGAAKQGVSFDEAQRVGDGGPVGLFDLRRNRRSASAHSVETLFTGEKVRS